MMFPSPNSFFVARVFSVPVRSREYFSLSAYVIKYSSGDIPSVFDFSATSRANLSRFRSRFFSDRERDSSEGTVGAVGFSNPIDESDEVMAL